MKKILIALAMVCMAAMPSVAQGNGNKDAKPTKEQVAQRRAEAVADRLMLGDGARAEFVPLYQKYLGELAEARKSGRTGTAKGSAQTDKEILEGIERELEAQQKVIDVKKSYYKKFKGMLNARQLKQLFNERRAAPGLRMPFGQPHKARLAGQAAKRG